MMGKTHVAFAGIGFGNSRCVNRAGTHGTGGVEGIGDRDRAESPAGARTEVAGALGDDHSIGFEMSARGGKRGRDGDRFGVAAVDAASDGDFGKMVALRGTRIERVPLAEALAEPKLVDTEIYATAEVFFG